MSRTSPDDVTAHPPGAWPRARRLTKRLLAPVDRFLAIQASSGILLLIAALIALTWANSPMRESYEALFHMPVGLRVGSWVFERDLHFVINDGLMTIFFFVVGLEIRREMDRGELSELRRAALPLAAALGGMVLPALLYYSLNAGRPSVVGWGVPMATDIAFAVGVLALLGERVPPALRVLLLALAVIDDLGAILVIALFYSSGITAMGLVVVAIGLVVLFAMQKLGVRNPWAFVPAGLVIWAGTYAAGIHPTLAGVVIGLVTPVHAWFGPRAFVERAEGTVAAVREQAERSTDAHSLLTELDRLRLAQREIVSPVERIEYALHGWVAYGIMPVFALANAGVTLGAATLDGDGRRVFFGVVAGLVVGKPLGIVGFSALAQRARLAHLPRGVSIGSVALVGGVGGIGFTMALFIAQLAFPAGPLLETAKLAVVTGSAIAAVLALGLGRLVLPATREAGIATTAAEAESATDL